MLLSYIAKLQGYDNTTFMNSLNTLKLYDSSMEGNITMYDKLPYNRDENLCGVNSIGIMSGNLIKSYKYTPLETISIENHDNDFLKRAEEKRRREEHRKEVLSRQIEEPSDLLTEEQMQNLLGSTQM